MTRMFLAVAVLMAWPALAAADADYRCSGIGQERFDEEAAFPHSLKLVYAQKDGSYLGDVHTRITGKDGAAVVDVTCDGPWLLVALPKGSWMIQAAFAGQSQKLSVNVSAKGRAKERVVRF